MFSPLEPCQDAPLVLSFHLVSWLQQDLVQPWGRGIAHTCFVAIIQLARMTSRSGVKMGLQVRSPDFDLEP